MDTNVLEVNHNHNRLKSETTGFPLNTEHVATSILTPIVEVDAIVIQEKLIPNPFTDPFPNGTMHFFDEDNSSGSEECIEETQWNLSITHNDGVQLNSDKFLKESWANMEDQSDKDDDARDPIFQHVITKSKKKKN